MNSEFYNPWPRPQGGLHQGRPHIDAVLIITNQGGPGDHFLYQQYYEKIRLYMSEEIEIAKQWLAKAANDLLDADNNLKAEGMLDSESDRNREITSHS